MLVLHAHCIFAAQMHMCSAQCTCQTCHVACLVREDLGTHYTCTYWKRNLDKETYPVLISMLAHSRWKPAVSVQHQSHNQPDTKMAAQSFVASCISNQGKMPNSRFDCKAHLRLLYPQLPAQTFHLLVGPAQVVLQLLESHCLLLSPLQLQSTKLKAKLDVLRVG